MAEVPKQTVRPTPILSVPEDVFRVARKATEGKSMRVVRFGQPASDRRPNVAELSEREKDAAIAKGIGWVLSDSPGFGWKDGSLRSIPSYHRDPSAVFGPGGLVEAMQSKGYAYRVGGNDDILNTPREKKHIATFTRCLRHISRTGPTAMAACAAAAYAALCEPAKTK